MLTRLLEILLLLVTGGFFAAAVRYPWLRPKWGRDFLEPKYTAQSCSVMACCCVLWSVLVAIEGWLVPADVAKTIAGAALVVVSGFYYSDFRSAGKRRP